jgi:hypothetical protein
MAPTMPNRAQRPSRCSPCCGTGRSIPDKSVVPQSSGLSRKASRSFLTARPSLGNRQVVSGAA